MNHKRKWLAGLGALALVGCGDDGGETDNTTTANSAGTSGTAGAGAGGAGAGGAGAGGAGVASAGASASSAGAAATAGQCLTEADVTSVLTSAEEACRAFCTADIAQGCDSTEAFDDCLSYKQCDIQDTGGDACIAASLVFFNCMRAQVGAVICDDPAGKCCEAQRTANAEACAQD